MIAMKKNLVLIACMFTVFAMQAQAPLSNQQTMPGANLMRDAKPVTKADLGKGTSDPGDRAVNYYWVNYSDAVDYAYNGWALENLASMPLWPDSTTLVVTGTGEDFYWYAHAYAHMFDPISNYISNFVDDNFTVIGDAGDWFNEDHSIVIDSARFYYFYDRFNTGYTDTLKVYVMAPNSSCYQEGYFLDQDADGDFVEGIDISLFLSKYNYVANRPNGTFTEYTFLLGDDDTASFNIASLQIPLDLTINKNSPDHFVGMAWQFIPGQPYSVGDTLLDFTDPPNLIANPLNRFWLLTNEELLEAAPISWDEYSNNQDGLANSEVRYNISDGGWNGFYLSTYAFVDAYAFEHAYVDWYVAPRGVNFLGSNPSPCVSLQKNFTDLSNFAAVPDDATYYWEFGDGEVSFERNPSHTYPIPGTYEVCLSVDYGGEAFDYCKNVTADYCVEVEDIANLTSFALYPNPTDDMLNINLTFGVAQDATIQLVSMSGQVMYTENTSVSANYTTAIDVSDIPAGVYMVRINSGLQSSVRTVVIN